MRVVSVAAVGLLALGSGSACGGSGDGAGALRSAVLQSDNRSIEVEFDSCHDSFDVTVAEETATEVVLTVSADGATDNMCADFGEVVLSEALGDRRVALQGAHGTSEISVVRPDGGGPPPTTSLSSLLDPP